MNSSHQLKILKILIVFGLLKIRLHQFYLTYIFNDFFTVITPKNILFYTEYETSEQQLDSKFNNKINPCLNSAQEISETQESSWMCPSSFYHLDFSLSCLNSDCWVVFYFFFLHILTQEANTNYHPSGLLAWLLPSPWNIYCCFLHFYTLRDMGFVYISAAVSRRMYLQNLAGIFLFGLLRN